MGSFKYASLIAGVLAASTVAAADAPSTASVLDRAAIQTEFRSARDIYERISGGAGPGGVKAVAPVGDEPIQITVPAAYDQVSLLGEVLDAYTPAGRESASPGRPVAIVSKVTIEYRPKPATKSPARQGR